MKQRKILGVIPARYASTRLPGKVLLDICGKPMIQHVYERAARARGLSALVVATDDARVADAVRTAPVASTISGSSITAGLSCTCSMVWWSARGVPWKVRISRRQE